MERESGVSVCNPFTPFPPPSDLGIDLIQAAKDVGVVLVELAHAGQAHQRAAGLVAVQRAELCQPQGQLPVGPL